MLEDRAGKDVAFLAENVAKFLAAAREAAGDRGRRRRCSARRAAGLPERGPRQGAQAGHRAERGVPDAADLHGRLLRELLQPVRPPVAGLRPGRGRLPHERRAGRPVLRARTRTARWSRSALVTNSKPINGPEFTMRYNLYRSAQINATRRARAISSGQAMKALEEVFARDHAERDGLRLLRHVLPGEAGQRRRLADGHLRHLAALRLPDPRRAVRELDAALQRAARHADRGVRRLRRAAGRRNARTTSTRRSAW